MARLAFLAAAAAVAAASAHVVPGQVTPSWPQTWQLNRSTMAMVCNWTGWVDPEWAAQWAVVDLDWNGDKPHWSSQRPMNCEEDMVANMAAVKAVNPDVKTWVYRNGVKALPWLTSVRVLLEDPAWWGFFMPKAGCSSTGKAGGFPDGRCGPNATQNLYHDFEQTPSGDCGHGVECGEYVFNHLNTSLTSWILGPYFFGNATGAGPLNTVVDGYYVDDGWSSSGPSEMDKDAVAKMGMTPSDVSAMTAAWAANQQAWTDKLIGAGKFLWGTLYGGQQTAPGWNQTDPQSTCAPYLRAQCGADAPSQNGTLFLGFSRTTHQHPWPLPWPEQDIAAFLLSRGPYAYVGYGWSGCVNPNSPFTRPALLDGDFGVPQGFCAETAPGSGVFSREYEGATVTLDCNAWQATFDWKGGRSAPVGA